MGPRSKEELLAYGVTHPDMVKELECNPVRPPQPSDPYYGKADIFAARAHRATTLREKHHLRVVPDPIPELVREEDRHIRMRDGAEIVVRIYTPTAPVTQPRPLIVMCHEGGWCMGDLSDEEVNCRLFSRDLGAVCVSIDYRLAPEHEFPTWINDCWDALQWAASNASALGADPVRGGFIIGGGSAGGNIAAVLAHVARDEGLSPPLTGQYLCVPAITCLMKPDDPALPARFRDEYLSHPDVTECIDPVLNGDGITAEFYEAVTRSDFKSPLHVPWLFGSSEDGESRTGHKGLPPAYFQVCGLDVLRDEGLIYERVLREEAGLRTRLDLYPGFGHYFWTNYPLLEQSRRFVEDTVKGARWLLEQSTATS